MNTHDIKKLMAGKPVRKVGRMWKGIFKQGLVPKEREQCGEPEL